MHSIYLLRHCEYHNPYNTIAGRLPVALSEKGKEQAEALKIFFADKNIGKIYSSAVLRTKQTPEIIASGTIPIIYDPRLLETYSAYQGYWEKNRTSGGWHSFLHKDELGGEGLADIQKRMVSFWKEITSNLSENIIICSHGDPLLTLYSHIHRLPLPDDNHVQADIPGWLEKGEYVELKWDKDCVKL